MFFTYFSFSYNIVKFQTCSCLQNYVIAPYKTIHLPHFLIFAQSASENRIASVCVCVTEKKNCLYVCVWVICVCVFSPSSVSIEVERGGGGAGKIYNRPFQHLRLLNLGKHSLLHIHIYCSAHTNILCFSLTVH